VSSSSALNDAAASHARNVAESQRRAGWEADNRNIEGAEDNDKGVAEGAHAVMDAVTNQDARDKAHRIANEYSSTPYKLATKKK
jgi:hypothetical protein